MRVVGIGGGHGLAETLRAALLYADDVAAVVAMADDGGSSGRLTAELGIPPPGDVRNCLIALARDPANAELLQHRFQGGALSGHTVGNLVIAALTELRGGFGEAVDAAGRLLAVEGRVYPATTALVTLRARVQGDVVEGQVAVGETTAPIETVWLEPVEVPAYPPAVQAILKADQVVLGPGSLYTSLIATVLVPGITDALRRTTARRIFVCNTRMQPGETGGLDAVAHLRALLDHCGGACVDAAIVQSPVLGDDGVAFDPGLWPWPEITLIEADVAAGDEGHDPRRLSATLAALS
ncbi:MAG: uridine diphosphate-N-acetylglucosamine-binding protein YvcK [Actinomycetota bacterium]|nr:uridine diphosphate-N-acetylglucosamine-binding protein YvcK [Actinomycetota bacterium]